MLRESSQKCGLFYLPNNYLTNLVIKLNKHYICMGISRTLLTEQMEEDFREEYLYLQALYYEWEQIEQEEMMNQRGRIHSEPKEKIQDESNNQYTELPF